MNWVYLEVLPSCKLTEFLLLSYVRSWVCIKQISTPMSPLELKVPFQPLNPIAGALV